MEAVDVSKPSKKPYFTGYNLIVCNIVLPVIRNISIYSYPILTCLIHEDNNQNFACIKPNIEFVARSGNKEFCKVYHTTQLLLK